MRSILPSSVGGILRAVLGIVARAAVAHADVEKAVRAEGEIAAVVIRERLADERERPSLQSQIEARRRIGDQPVRRRSPEARDDGVAGAVGEVDEEAAAARVVGRERQAEQAPLAAGDDGAAQVEKVGAGHHAVADDPDAPALLDDELHRAVGRILDDRYRARESGHVGAQPQRRLCHEPRRETARDANQDERGNRSTGPHLPIIVKGAMTLRPRLWVVASFLFAACGGSSPTPGGGTETITGAERFGWDQPAADAGELASFRYALYVDDVRSEAADATCATAQSAAGFACTARMPTMTPGVHNLQVASFVIDGGAVRESPRSAAVRVTKR